jgi:hypothetical protein
VEAVAAAAFLAVLLLQLLELALHLPISFDLLCWRWWTGWATVTVCAAPDFFGGCLCLAGRGLSEVYVWREREGGRKEANVGGVASCIGA